MSMMVFRNPHRHNIRAVQNIISEKRSVIREDCIELGSNMTIDYFQEEQIEYISRYDCGVPSCRGVPSSLLCDKLPLVCQVAHGVPSFLRCAKFPVVCQVSCGVPSCPWCAKLPVVSQDACGVPNFL